MATDKMRKAMLMHAALTEIGIGMNKPKIVEQFVEMFENMEVMHNMQALQEHMRSYIDLVQTYSKLYGGEGNTKFFEDVIEDVKEVEREHRVKFTEFKTLLSKSKYH